MIRKLRNSSVEDFPNHLHSVFEQLDNKRIMIG